MGGIRKPKKKYFAPGHPWQKTRLAEELIYVGEYGLRNKRELWKYRTQLTHFRSSARDLVALSMDKRGVRETQLLNRLNRLGLIDENSQLDDILNLTIRDILERRLQTQVLRQGLAKTMHHARQLIVHGHIVLDQHRVTSPGMLLYRDQEKALKYAAKSPYTNPLHPEIPKGEKVSPAPEAREPAAKEKIEVKIPQVREIKEVELEEDIDVDEELPDEGNNKEATDKPPVKGEKGAAKEKDAK
ncbi:MAG: 30S ribosomal protein S4 [Promethearchaeota archaeon]